MAPFVALLLAALLLPSQSFPTPKQRSNAATALSMMSSSQQPSVAIVGMGVLGTSLAKQLLEGTDYTLTGITKSTARHSDLRKELCDNDRLSLTTMEEALSSGTRYQNVVFCAPPSGFEDYPSAVADASKLRSDSKDGSFIFTSSGGVYPDSFDGEVVNESTKLDEGSPRKARGIQAEKACLENDGCVLRLSGLYTLERGAHNYWLEKANGVVKGREDGIINLLHYDDAASSVVAALKVGPRVNSGKLFLISDGHYTTRKGICESALKSERYRGCEMPTFEGAEGETRGKIYDGTWSEDTLGWKAKYTSFDEFMKSMA
jgi:nucleoside-diphosphate-sugar epimerase